VSVAGDLAYCGRCGAHGLGFEDGKRHVCARCGWLFYRNAAAAVFAILELGGKILLVRRAREPAAGTLDLPGGFLDLGERAEAGLARELAEELGIGCGPLHYLGSYPNVYPYAGVTYHTLDLCFHARLERPPAAADVDTDELDGFVLLAPADIDLDAIGLDAPRRALHEFLARAGAQRG
jgi:NADH pyrophosphatase NudC (nudix superfamily)